MPLYLDTRGRTSVAIGICGRCSVKYPIGELTPDPNYPGLLVCPDGCKDVLDPYRLPARVVERVALDFARPDVSVAVPYSGGVNVPLYTNPIFGINQINAARPWAANTLYSAGDSINPQSVDLETTTLPQNWWLCLLGGTSGATPPDWPTQAGVILGDFQALTSDLQSVINLLDDLGVIQLQNDAQTDDLIADDSVNPIDAGLQLLADNGLFLYKDGNGDGTVTWLCLGLYPN